MKKNVIKRLEALFPELKGIEFSQLSLLGPRNILSLLHELKKISDAEGDSSNSDMKDCEAELSTLDKDDTLRLKEIGAYAGYLSLRINTFKLLESNLKAQYNIAIRADDRFRHCPVLPVLRNSACFTTGDDVMVFTGKTGLDAKHDNLPFEHPFKWAIAKILTWQDPVTGNTVFVYTKQPSFNPERTLDGHMPSYSKATPLIFGRQEFFCLRKMIQFEYGWGFVLNFLYHCYRYDSSSNCIPYESLHFEELKKILLDPSVENISDDKLKEGEREWFSEILKKLSSVKMLDVFINVRKSAKEKGHVFSNDEVGGVW